MLSTPGTLFFSWPATHHLWKNYRFVLRLPGDSKLTHDFASGKAASCYRSGSFSHQVLPVAGRAICSLVCLVAVTPQFCSQWNNGRQNHDGQKGSMLMPCREFNLPFIGFCFLLLVAQTLWFSSQTKPDWRTEQGRGKGLMLPWHHRN